MNRARSRGSDHVLRISSVDELFSAEASPFMETGRLGSAVEETFREFLTQKRVDPKERVVVVLPARMSEAGASADAIAGMARQYCRLRAAQCHREGHVAWRQGFRSLWWGLFLFAVGVGLSYYFTEPYVPKFWDQLLGNGVFLVVAWIGLWYPLDLIFLSRQPLQREARTWEAMEAMPWIVRFDDAR